MIVPIHDDLRIRSTELNWELQRPRVRNSESSWESFSYFPTFCLALEAAVQRDIRRHPAQSLAEAIEAVDGILQAYADLIPDQCIDHWKCRTISRGCY